MVEQRSPKPRVQSSSLCAPAIVVADCVSFATTFIWKSHRLTLAVAPPLPKSLRLFGDPINYDSSVRFEPFFLAFLTAAHGLRVRAIMPEAGIDFASGGIRPQRSRLLHHQNNIKMSSSDSALSELSLFSAV